MLRSTPGGVTLAIPRSAVALTTGELSRSKVFLLRGVTRAQAEARLAAWISST